MIGVLADLFNLRTLVLVVLEDTAKGVSWKKKG
jgi:hypothetical protein